MSECLVFVIFLYNPYKEFIYVMINSSIASTNIKAYILIECKNLQLISYNLTFHKAELHNYI